MVIPEGTTGELTFLAVWVESPTGGGMGGQTGGAGGSGSGGTQQDAQEQQDAAEQEQTQTQPQTQQNARRTRTASSSTKVSFSSDVGTVVPTLEAATESSSFPWGWVFGGLGVLGILAYLAARLVNRKAR